LTTTAAASPARAGAATLVLFTLAAGQFLITLDSAVMNVSIATVAEDLGTTVSGIQGAITAYTLVMAALMITGAKVGAMIGRKRAFAIGCVIYGCGSFVTAIAPNLPVLLFGWSFLEGVGAALILPAIVALVAGNFAVERRPDAYGLVAAAGAIAIAVGPLIGGTKPTRAPREPTLHSTPTVMAGSQGCPPRSPSSPCSRSSRFSSTSSSPRGSPGRRRLPKF
jgi:MFS family permease